MLITLTWRIQEDKTIDIKVNREQKIGETMKILRQKGLYPSLDDRLCVLQSLRTKERLNPALTYVEQGIYTGDILVLSK